jgi:hypothetical protein
MLLIFLFFCVVFFYLFVFVLCLIFPVSLEYPFTNGNAILSIVSLRQARGWSDACGNSLACGRLMDCDRTVVCCTVVAVVVESELKVMISMFNMAKSIYKDHFRISC